MGYKTMNSLDKLLDTRASHELLSRKQTNTLEIEMHNIW